MLVLVGIQADTFVLFLFSSRLHAIPGDIRIISNKFGFRRSQEI